MFGDPVERIADSLKPLGEAGRVVAESYAVATEMRRIRLDATRAADDKEIRLALLEQRRRESSAILRHMQQEVGQADASAKALRECMVNMQRKMLRNGLLPEERLAYQDLTAHFATMVVQHQTNLTDGVAVFADTVLNGSGVTALAPTPRAPQRSERVLDAGRDRRRRR